MRKVWIVVLALGILGIESQNSLAASSVVTAESQNSFELTWKKLKATVVDKGFRVVAEIDHEAMAKQSKMKLAPSRVLVFGNPKIGAKLMSRFPGLALELPMKIAVYQGRDGKVRVSYRKPADFLSAHSVPKMAPPYRKMPKVLESIVRSARL